MVYDAKNFFPQLEDDSKCGNCLYKNVCDNYKVEHNDWLCGNWKRDPNAIEQLTFNFEESEEKI